MVGGSEKAITTKDTKVHEGNLRLNHRGNRGTQGFSLWIPNTRIWWFRKGNNHEGHEGSQRKPTA
ncbi:hypothetical protein SBA7_1310002 [Candidatus Sulfotelmatobacter sp. SbA7]|nr:hypothetical protein SBA7_1310002 [Candidatus Sulfotelmatobacter sp. SbA7]